MTDEERQKLCVDLRTFHDPLISKDWITRKCAMAADEMERLTERIKQLEKTVEALGRM